MIQVIERGIAVLVAEQRLEGCSIGEPPFVCVQAVERIQGFQSFPGWPLIIRYAEVA